jgi:hypothetical protein
VSRADRIELAEFLEPSTRAPRSRWDEFEDEAVLGTLLEDRWLDEEFGPVLD